MRSSELDRSEVFLETKIWISDYGYEKTLHGFEKSARKLRVDQIDLLILHRACHRTSRRLRRPTGAWRRCSETERYEPSALADFMVEHPTTLLERTTVVPAVNQIEVHPYFAQRDVQTLDAEHGILTQGLVPDRRHHLLPPGSTAAPCRTRSSATSQRHTTNSRAGHVALAPSSTYRNDCRAGTGTASCNCQAGTGTRGQA